MGTFKDTEGRQWTVAITGGTIRRVLKETGKNLTHLFEDGPTADGKLAPVPLHMQLAGDPLLLLDVLRAICEPQIRERSLTDEQFLDAIDGDAIEQAWAAVAEGLVAFSRSSVRGAQLKLLRKFREYEATMGRMADQKADAVEISEEAIQAALDGLGDSSTSLPESSESTATT